MYDTFMAKLWMLDWALFDTWRMVHPWTLTQDRPSFPQQEPWSGYCWQRKAQRRARSGGGRQENRPPFGFLWGGRGVVVLARAGGSGEVGSLATSSWPADPLSHQGSDLGRSEIWWNENWSWLTAHLVLLHIWALQLHLLGWGHRRDGREGEWGGAGGVQGGGGQHPLPSASIEHRLVRGWEQEKEEPVSPWHPPRRAPPHLEGLQAVGCVASRSWSWQRLAEYTSHPRPADESGRQTCLGRRICCTGNAQITEI